MTNKLPYTPNSRIRACLRQLWMRSRERAAAAKRDAYTCQECGVKHSKAKGREVKVVVHHKHGINWDGIIELIRKMVLQTPDRLEVLCVNCHKKKHDKRITQGTGINTSNENTEGKLINPGYNNYKV